MNKINDILMDAYFAAKSNRIYRARLLLGCAASMIRMEMDKTPSLKTMYINLHSIRDKMEKGSMDANLEDISREVRKSYDLAA